MPSILQAEPHADDPHDEVAAVLRNYARPHAKDLSELNIAPPDRNAAADSSDASVEPQSRIPDMKNDIGEMRLAAGPGRSRRGIGGALITICVGIAVTVGWQTYGEAAKQGLAQVVPRLMSNALTPTPDANAAEPQQAAAAIEPSPIAEAPPVSEAAASVSQDAAAAPATVAPATAASAPTQASVPPELAKTIESMASEIAALKQAVDTLNASNQQLTRDVAKAAERDERRRSSAKTAKTAPTTSQRTSKPPPQAVAAMPPTTSVPPPQAYPQRQVYPQPQPLPQAAIQRDAYIPAPAPPRLPPEPGFTGAPRPPMPLQ